MMATTTNDAHKKIILLSEINENNMIDIEDNVICNDPDIELAVMDYQKGKLLEAESKKLIERSKKVFDEKIYRRHIKRLITETSELSYTEYKRKTFDSKLFEELNPQLYSKFLKESTQKRYNVKPLVDININ